MVTDGFIDVAQLAAGVLAKPYDGEFVNYCGLDAAHELVTLTKGFGRKIRAYNV